MEQYDGDLIQSFQSEDMCSTQVSANPPIALDGLRNNAREILVSLPLGTGLKTP